MKTLYVAGPMTGLPGFNADGIALLPNWHRSRGAHLEVHIARALDMPCEYVDWWVERAGVIR